MTDKLTFGEERVGVYFNPSQKEEVKKVKETCAFLIDFLNSYKNGIAVDPENTQLSPTEYNQKNGEIFRLISIAQTTIEEACMWAVKALVKQ